MRCAGKSRTASMARLRCCSLLGRAAFQQRQLQVQMGRAVDQRPQILGQAGASKRESRLQICRRAVELHVFAQRGHHFIAIHAHLFAERPDFVGERDFHRVKGIAGVFDHLRRAQRHQSHVFAPSGRYRSGDRCTAAEIVAAHHKQRRLERNPGPPSLPAETRDAPPRSPPDDWQRRAAPTPRMFREKPCCESPRSAVSGAAEDARRSPPPRGAIGAALNCRSFPTAFPRKPARCPHPATAPAEVETDSLPAWTFSRTRSSSPGS